MVKLFSKSFQERRLFEKRQHPKTFIIQEFFRIGFSCSHEKRSLAAPFPITLNRSVVVMTSASS
ncbi:hypothetical protein CFR77_05915 [Komagataeibacter sucrofermentans]|uniref:Uncharacterized protein n=1 Tax=Komagataeibacter sucrofermentans TaxID=1053551 RepID=A0A318QKP7_9PROT|nr:hypothetical protein CFR77_05915 [Komagataeibacter sucrofermentans]